jgi:hypothetical protein
VLDAVSGLPSADWPRQHAPPCMVIPPRAPVPFPIYKYAHGLSCTPSHAFTLVQAGDCHRERAPPPTKPPELWPSWPALPSHPQAAISAQLASPETREAPQALRPSRASPEDPNRLAGLLLLIGERGPGKSLRHSPIPPVYRLCVTQSSLLSQPIELSRREQARILAADELPRLRTWTSRLRPPPTPTRTST